MNKTENNACAHTHFIEEEYISDMLGLDMTKLVTAEPVTTESESKLESKPESKQEKKPVTTSNNIDLNAAYNSDSFECQIFSIAGLNIGVPTASINQTLKQQDIVTNNDNAQDNLFTGTVNHNGSDINIINIEYLIMNGVSNNTENKSSNNPSADIIVLQGLSYGFIADAVCNTQTIINKDVHWRDNNSQRLWLAGTVAQRGLALLDITGAIHLLRDSIK